jgi:alkylhydroperoxidase family enzyme
MPRIAYIEDNAAGPADLVERICARRGGKLLNLDRMLLHSAALARGWNTLLGAIRGELAVPAKLRELAICAVAVLNGADYEFQQHVTLFLEAGGSAIAAKTLLDFPILPAGPSAFSATENAVLQLTLEMTRNISVNEVTFERVTRALQNNQHVVELVAIIATYNMVSRFLVALQVEMAGEEQSSAGTRA